MPVTGLIDPSRQGGFPDRPDRFEHEPSITLSNENSAMRIGRLRCPLDRIDHRVSWQRLKIKVALLGLVSTKSKNKRDEGENKENVFEAVLKTNIHRASKWKLLQFIGKYSAGCQVFRSIDDFNLLISLCEKQIENGHGNSFTYTLFDSYEVFKNNWKKFI